MTATPFTNRKRPRSSSHLTIVQPLELPVGASGDDDELAGLVRRAARGSAAAFDELARRVYGRVRAWAGRLTQDGDDAEDVAQLVMLRLHQRVGDFEGRSRFTTWLYRVTRNVALERRRTDERHARLLARRQAHATPSDATPVIAEPTAGGSDAARVARLVHAYLAELPPRQRQVFELVDLRGQPASRVAESLGIEPATARVLLLKARRTIRRRMLAEHAALLEELRS